MELSTRCPRHPATTRSWISYGLVARKAAPQLAANYDSPLQADLFILSSVQAVEPEEPPIAL